MMIKILLLLILLLSVHCGFITDLGTKVEKTESALYGWVRDSLSRMPLSGVRVKVSKQAHETLTDKEGFFTIDTLFTGEKEFTLSAAGYYDLVVSKPLESGINSIGSISMLRTNHAPAITKVEILKTSARDKSISLRLKATVSDSDFTNVKSTEQLRYTICLDTVQGGNQVSEGILNWPTTASLAEFFLPETFIRNLLPNKTYYWNLVIKDTLGAATPTATGTFSTIESTPSCSSGMVLINSENLNFCMDQYEVTNAEYDSFALNFDLDHAVSQFSNGPNKPVTNVRLVKADEYCRSIKKRLCTPSEWTIATGGIDRENYPYGNIYQKDKCNTEKTAFQSITNGGGADDVGINEECVSPYGIYDLSGNVAEWIYYGENVAYAEDYNSDDNQLSFVYAGGAWSSGKRSGNLARDTVVFAASTFYIQQDVGFRCCSRPLK